MRESWSCICNTLKIYPVQHMQFRFACKKKWEKIPSVCVLARQQIFVAPTIVPSDGSKIKTRGWCKTKLKAAAKKFHVRVPQSPQFIPPLFCR